MGTLRQVLVHVSGSPHARAAIVLGAALARTHDAEVLTLHAVEPMATGAYLTAEASGVAEQMRSQAEAARREHAAAVVAEVARSIGCGLAFESVDGDPLSAVLQRARSADLLVLGQREPGVDDGLTAGFAPRALTGAGCPVLFVPYADAHAGSTDAAPRCGTRVLVAWSETRESARALRDALPLLRRAAWVELVRFAARDEAGAEPLERVSAHLRRHGISAQCTVRSARAPTISERMALSWTPDAPIAEALLSEAADRDADLIVMGGYSHMRAWELMLGGVTRTILQSMTVPVLMSH